MTGRAATSCLLVVVFAAGGAQAASISFDEDPIVLGRTESATAIIEAEETPGTEDRPLRVSVNVGSFGEVTRIARGKYRAVYHPPRTRFPQFAFVAVGRETGPDAPIAFLRVPLYGATRLPIETRSGSVVSVEVSGRVYGPVKASARGKASVAILVPPGVREGLIVATDPKGVVTQRKVLVADQPYNRLTAHVVPHAVLANGRDQARLEIYYDLEAELPLTSLVVTASAGLLTFQSREANKFVYRYLAPSEGDAKAVRFSVTVATDPVAQAAPVLELGLPDPTRVVVRPPARAIPAGSSAPFTLLVLDSEGLGVPAVKVVVSCAGKDFPPPRYVGSGLYEATFLAPATYPPTGAVEIEATVVGGAGRRVNGAVTYQLEPPRTLVAGVSPDPVPADGATEAALTLDFRDGTGAPVKGAHLAFTPSHGQVGALEEVAEGRYRVTYVPPGEIPEGEVTVKVEDGLGFEQAVRIPLRPRARRLFLGVRVGLTHSLGDLFSGRAGLELFVPLRLFGRNFGLGLSASYGQASKSVTDSTGALFERVDVSFVPTALRLGLEVYSGARLSVNACVGAVLTWASFRTASGGRLSRFGPGALGSLGGVFELGPGQVVGDLSLAYAPIVGGDFRLQAGGLGIELGYRLAIF